MQYLTFDPGKHTGWALYHAGPTEYMLMGITEADGYEFLDKVVPYIRAMAGRELTVVGERFVISGGTVEKGRTDENWSIEQIGVIRHECRWAGVPFELQSAGDAKKFAKNDRLKEVGWYTPGGGGHHNDAARHMLLCLARHEPETLGRLLTTL